MGTNEQSRVEIWDVYDQQGKVTGKLKTRSDPFHEGEYHLGASLWLVNSQGKLLIQKRALSKRINPGKWSITGGAVRAGESSAQGCIRETGEEIGLFLTLDDIKLLSRSFGKDIIFDDYVAIYDFSIENAVLQEEEVSEIKWAGIEEIRELFSNGLFMLNNINELDKIRFFIQNNIGESVMSSVEI